MKYLKYMVLLFLPCLMGATYYVSNDGDDSNNGTSTVTAWEHVVRACTTSTIVGGDTIFILPGLYDEVDPGYATAGPMQPRQSGSEGNPIVWRSYPGAERPIIYGDSAERYACNIYNVDWLVIDSLEVSNSKRGINIFSATNITVQNCKVHHSGGDYNNNAGSITILFDNSYNISIDACSLSYAYDGTFTDSSQTGQVSGIHVYDCVDCSYTNNVIWGNPVGCGINLKAHHDCCYATGTPVNAVISGNKISECYYGMHLGADLDSVLIHHNEITNCVGSINIWLNSGTNPPGGTGSVSRMWIYNNTIYNAEQVGIYQITPACEDPWDSLKGFNVFNNIIANVRNVHGNGGNININIENDQYRDLYFDYNCYYNAWVCGSCASADRVGVWEVDANPGINEGDCLVLSDWQDSCNCDGNTINEYPMFIDTTTAGGYNLQLDADSPCAASGRGGGWPTYMGAYSSYRKLEINVSTNITIGMNDEKTDSICGVPLIWNYRDYRLYPKR